MEELYQTFEEDFIQILLKFSQNTEQRTFPNSFYETIIILTTKPEKDTTRKETYRPVSMMNIDAKIFNKILANKIREHIKRIIHHYQVRFNPWVKRMVQHMQINQCATPH